MKNLTIRNETYQRIFLKDDNTLLKYSMLKPKAWEELKEKNIDYVNNPSKVMNLTKEEQCKYPEYQSKIELPILKEYKTFYDETFTKDFDTESTLKLLKHNLHLLKDLHNNEVYHTDIFSENIMINIDKQLCYIDLDASVINDHVSPENIYADDMVTIKQVKELSKRDDKLDTLNLYLCYLVRGNFKVYRNEVANSNHLSLPTDIKLEINAYQYGESIPNSNYYFEDIIEDLIKQGYEAPKLKIRKMTNNH